MIMNSCKEIGGYFGLELGEKYNKVPRIALNSARNCLRYIIKTYSIKEIWLPYYTCSVIKQSIQNEDCKINFYFIDKNFYPVNDFPRDAYILYTNYFGICSKQVKKMSENYKNLIVDNSQAFYMPECGFASFNSIRKFFGVSDGAFLNCKKQLNIKLEQDTSYQRFSHLLKRLDVNASFSYQDFKDNDNSLIDEPIKLISNLTKSIYQSIDINRAKDIRLINFNYLDSHLSQSNELKFKLSKYDIPMVYPYLCKKAGLRGKLIKNKIYVAQYWEEMPENTQEEFFQKYLLPLPIDQRYTIDDMKKIIEVING